MMQTHTDTKQPANRRAQRELVHDLRNLFSIVASAKQMLERSPTQERRDVLLEALEDAAVRGGALTTGLLSNRFEESECALVDINSRLLELRALMCASAGPDVEVDLDLYISPARVRLVCADFDAAILELITNAVAAESRRVVVRARDVALRTWIMIRDNGRGMSRALLDQARCGADTGGAHGAGICRVRQFVQAAHGRFLIRSQPEAGTTIILNLPSVLHSRAQAWRPG